MNVSFKQSQIIWSPPHVVTLTPKPKLFRVPHRTGIPRVLSAKSEINMDTCYGCLGQYNENWHKPKPSHHKRS